MSRPELRRRDLLAGVAAAGAALLLFWQADLGEVSVAGRLLRRLGGTAGPRAPALTGVADDELLRQLWWLSTRIAARWQMAEFVSLTEAEFAGFIAEKTTQAPSYLTEYREAGRLLREIGTAMQSDERAFDQLFARPAGVPGLGSTRLGRLQKFVIAEIIGLQVASGGFRAFGYRNYRGFAGGPLSDPARPPYRSL